MTAEPGFKQPAAAPSAAVPSAAVPSAAVPSAAVPSAVIELVGRARRILLLTHHNPDGDALGSAFALARILGRDGRQVDLALTGFWSEHLSFLLDGLSLVEKPGVFSGYDLVVLLDCHTFGRLGEDGSTADDLPALVVIDHHPLTEGEKAGENWFIQPAASSTGELVWLFLKACRLQAPPEAAEALLLAIASDTGFFSQSNVTAGTLEAAAGLVEWGGCLERVHRRLKADLPLRRLKLMGSALDSLRLHCGGRLAIMAVTPDLLEKAGAVMADTEDLVEMGRSLAGVTLSALIKDEGRGVGRVRVSLRSREPVNASALAGFFGGGGHRLAAAYNDPEAATAEEAAANLLARAERCL